MNICTRLKRIRVELGLNQSDLAESVGIATATYWGYEKGKINMSISFLQALKKQYGIDTNWLLYDEGTRFKADTDKHFASAVIVVLRFLAVQDNSIEIDKAARMMHHIYSHYDLMTPEVTFDYLQSAV